MPDLKSELINIQQQIQSSIEDRQRSIEDQQRSIETQKNIDRQIQYLIDGIDLSPNRSPESIEAQMKSLIDVLGGNLYHHLKDDFSQQIGSVRSEIDEIKKDRISLLPQNQQEILANKSVELQNQGFSNNWRKLSDDYNRLGVSFGSSYPVVSVDETKDIIETRRAKSGSNVFLSPSTAGKFWLVEINGHSCLMPNPKESFNKHNSEVLESLFFFQEPYSAGSKRIFLISPAIVCTDLSGEVTTWQLQEKGNISFTL
jgi:hypothetical protein